MGELRDLMRRAGYESIHGHYSLAYDRPQPGLGWRRWGKRAVALPLLCIAPTLRSLLMITGQVPRDTSE